LSWATVTVTITGQDQEATGNVGYSGLAAEGGTLNANLSATDADGTITGTGYQWQVKLADGTWQDIAGRQFQALHIPSDQSLVDQHVRVVAVTTDQWGGTTVFTGGEQAIANVNDAPALTQPQAVLGAGVEDQPYVVTKAALLAGFTDEDGDPLSVSGLTANHGTVVDNLDGTFTVTPASNFNGTMTLSYSVVDGNGGSVAGSRPTASRRSTMHPRRRT
jgi:hypothetical protein